MMNSTRIYTSKAKNFCEIELLQEIARYPLHASKNAFLYMLESLSELVSASNAMALIVERHKQTRRWNVIRLVPINYSNAEHDQHKELLAQMSSQQDTEQDLAHLELIGAHRTYLSQHFGAPPSSPDCEEEHYHLVHVIHVHNDLEIYVCLGRADPPPFSIDDLERLAPLTDGLLPTFMRYCLLLGLMPGQETTTPREQETLEYLLCGLSEKEIAQQMSLTYRSAHQYVTTIYRKLGVNSRAQLMALWLSPPCCVQI